MTCYVDDFRAPHRRMKMSHLIADSREELLAMADRIGVARRWLQKAGTYREHFDVCEEKRRLAIACGAKAVSYRELGRLIYERRPE